MKQLVLIALMAIIFMSSCNVEENEDISRGSTIDLSQADRDEIMQAFLATEDAWNKGDLEEFMKGYKESENIAFVGASGPTYGYQATLERYKNGYPDTTAMGKLDFEVLKLYGIDNITAVMIGRFYLNRTIGDQQGYYTLIWQKTADGWRIISDHSSGGPVE